MPQRGGDAARRMELIQHFYLVPLIIALVAAHAIYTRIKEILQ